MSDAKRNSVTDPGSKRELSSSEDDDIIEVSDDDDMIYYEEEESESEPEIDCDNWDLDCGIVNTNSKTSLIGYHLMPTCCRDPDNVKKIKLNPPEIRKNLLEPGFIDKFQDSWQNGIKFAEKNTELIADPFRVCVFNNFIDDSEILSRIRQEFYEIKWNTRSMDLYEFFQSEDLKRLTEFEEISKMYNFLRDQVMGFVSRLTRLELTHISATCSYYGNSDYLLVHDDQREDRLVAFVLYFTGIDQWSEDKGGALQLLDKDDQGHPRNVVRNIYPKHNQLVIFPVASDSYHQVAEVTSLSDCRFSINGWFHTKVPPIFRSPKFEPIADSLYSAKSLKRPIEFDIDLKAWLTEDYLSCKLAKQIQAYFEENSEICLKNFLKLESFSEISEILFAPDTLRFIKIGPPNRYNYEIVDTKEVLPNTLERFLKLFQSRQFFELLHRFTDLELTSFKFELQRWVPGNFSLLTDYDWQSKKELDLVVHFGCNSNSDVVGARTQYVSTDEDEIQSALITLEPEENCLNIVYRDTARLTKYFSKLSRNRCFYTLICSYSEEE